MDQLEEPGNRPTLSVVVPVYHGSTTLEELVERTDAAISRLGVTHEYIFVDDASSDDSWEVLCRIVAASTNALALRLMRNFGQHNALMCGFKHSGGEYVITLDDDLQNPPEEIGHMYRRISETGADVVFGYFDERSHSRLRNVTSRLARWLLVRSIPRLDPHYSNFRIIRRGVIDLITQQSDDFLYTDGLITWATDRTDHVVVRHEQRKEGRSNYTIGRLLSYFGVILFTFTVFPLRLLALVGSALAVGGFGLGTYYVGMKLTGRLTEEGFAGIIVSVLIIGGIQLLSLSVIGEYVGRIFLKQSRKPQFAIRERRGVSHGRRAVVSRN